MLLTTVLTSFDFPRIALSTFCFRRLASLSGFQKPVPAFPAHPWPWLQGILSPVVSEPVLAEKKRLKEAGFDILGLWMLYDYYFLIYWEQIRKKQIMKKSLDTNLNWVCLCYRHSLKKEIWTYPSVKHGRTWACVVWRNQTKWSPWISFPSSPPTPLISSTCNNDPSLKSTLPCH